MSQQWLSPLVQVMHTPLAIVSQVHMPIVKLQQHTMVPFIIMQQLHMLPAMAAHGAASQPFSLFATDAKIAKTSWRNAQTSDFADFCATRVSRAALRAPD